MKAGLELKDIKLISDTDGKYIFHHKEGKKPQTSCRKKIDGLRETFGSKKLTVCMKTSLSRAIKCSLLPRYWVSKTRCFKASCGKQQQQQNSETFSTEQMSSMYGSTIAEKRY